MVSIFLPAESAVDDIIDIKITNLAPNQNVSILAQTSRNEVTLSSFANYKADDNGVVDLTRHQALPGGSYIGVEPMGLFWSSELTSQVKIPFKMLNGNDLDKWEYQISVFDGHRHSLAEALNAESALAKATSNRLFMPRGVRRFNVYFGRLRGVLFLPEGQGKFPAVIDIFGGAHGLVAYRGGLFAKHGYVCLCVAYAAYADLPRELTILDSEYFDLGFEFLSKHPDVDPNAIGIFGSCLGGTIANALARCQPGIKAVAAVSPEAFAGTFEYKLKENGRTSSVKGIEWDVNRLIERDGAADVRNCLATSLEKSGGYNSHLLDYGKIKAPCLFMYGSDDQFFVIDYILPILREQFEKEKKTNVEVIVYPDAGHIIQPPYLPMFGKYHSPAFGRQIWFGGKLVPHVRAQEKMWRKTLDFFNVHLRPHKLSKL